MVMLSLLLQFFWLMSRVYVPGFCAKMLVLVSPVLHRSFSCGSLIPERNCKALCSLKQKLEGRFCACKTCCGSEISLATMVSLEAHDPLLTLTMYVPPAETVILFVLLLLFQRKL